MRKDDKTGRKAAAVAWAIAQVSKGAQGFTCVNCTIYQEKLWGFIYGIYQVKIEKSEILMVANFDGRY